MEKLTKHSNGQWELAKAAPANPHHSTLSANGYKYSGSATIPYGADHAQQHTYTGKDRSIAVIQHPKTGKWEWESKAHGAKSPSHGGLSDQTLHAHISDDIEKAMPIEAPPPPPSEYTQANEPASITGVNMRKNDIHPSHLGSVDHEGGQTHVFTSTASHHKHLPGMHVEVSGASTLGKDKKTWPSEVHDAINHAQSKGYPRVVLHEPKKNPQVYNQSTMKSVEKTEDKFEKLKTNLKDLKSKTQKAEPKSPQKPDGHLGEYWKEPLRGTKPRVPVADKIIYNVKEKPAASVAPKPTAPTKQLPKTALEVIKDRVSSKSKEDISKIKVKDEK